MPERTYQGWPSYETWLAYTWLSNDPLLDATCALLACDATSTREAADELADFVEELRTMNVCSHVAQYRRGSTIDL